MAVRLYNEYIKVDPNFIPVFSRNSDRTYPDKWQSFYPHTSFKNILKDVVETLEKSNETKDRSIWMSGAYGTGKTYASFVIKHILEDSIDSITPYFIQNGMETLLARVKGVRAKGRILVVQRSASAGINTQDKLFNAIVESVRRAVSDAGLTYTGAESLSDIKALQELGAEIEVTPSTQKRFSLIGRRFDLPELKTLIDAVESAKFIPKKKSTALVEKLGSLTSQHNTEKLVRNVDVENRLKADNEKIYYIMEALNDAINASKKVSFQYFTYNVRKEQKLKYDGYTYVFSPYKLIWNGDYYYVVGFSEKHKGIGSFRVDRIARCPKILDEDAVYPPKNFDLNVYLNSMFRMYNGQRKQIELVCSNDVMDAIIDKFGKDVHVLVNDMKSFRAIIETSVGSVFYSWIFGFGGKVVIKSPEDVKDEYSSMVLNAGKSLGLFEYGESENQTV